MAKEPIYQKIKNYYIKQIKNNDFSPHQRLPTEMEIASMFDTSRVTVMKALNDLEYEGIIYRIQGKGSFVANPQDIRINNTLKLISFITPFRSNDINRQDKMDIIRGCQSYLSEKGYFLTVHDVGDDETLEKETLLLCKKNGINGIILYPNVAANDFFLINNYIFNNYPLVLLDRIWDGLPVPCVQSDNYKAGYDVTEFLIKKGYDEILFISHCRIQSALSIKDRFIGYCKALKDNNRPLKEENCIHDFHVSLRNDHLKFDYSDNSEMFDALINSIMLKNQNKTVGIVAINEELALSLLKSLLKLKVDIPGRIGLVGFSSGSINEFNGIQITSAEQDCYEIGRMSAKTVLDKINGVQDIKQDILINVKLIVGNSTI